MGSLLVVIGDFFGMHTMFVYPTSHTVENWMQGIIVGNYLVGNYLASYLYTSRLGGVYLLVLQMSDVRGESGSA